MRNTKSRGQNFMQSGNPNRKSPAIRFAMGRNLLAGWSLGLGVLCTLGCGSGEPFDMTPVSGKVTYEDGSLIPGHRVEVRFVPQDVKSEDPKVSPRFAGAEVDVATGEFIESTTHTWGDGVIVGRHKVLVRSFDQNERPTGAVPREYTDERDTPLEMDITYGMDPVEIQVPKPKGK